MFEVVVIELSTGKQVHSIPCKTEKSAEQVERGVMENLDTDNYRTTILEYNP